METLEKFKEQHITNYKKAIIENIKNNTNILVDKDISSLIEKPPLDSMDLIKCKFLNIAKKYKMVLNTDFLDKILNLYRKDVSKCFEEIKQVREKFLIDKVNKFELLKETDVIKINKKDFNEINKKLKKIFKDQLKDSISQILIVNIESIFKNSDNIVKQKEDIIKYLNGNYQKGIIDNFDIKILVKDTTLINSSKEQAERYLFTLTNSRLLNSDLDK